MMSLAQRFTLPLALLSLVLLAGCGSNNNVTVNKNGYANSDFSGTYVFSFSGTDVNVSAQTESFFAIAGTITADGNGNITGGTVDINDANLPSPGVFTAQALSASTYSVSSDGRGSGTLITPQGTFGIDFVLTSDSSGLISRFDSSGSGSGTFELQGSTTQSALTSLAFTMFGSDSNFNFIGTVGAFTLNPSGSITSGVQDFNDAGTGIPNQTITVGSLVLTSGTNGTATLTTSFVPGGLTFDVWVVDSNHLKLIETDTTSGLALAGDAFPQQTSFPSGQIVFGLAGGNVNSPVAAGGFATSDVNGNLSAGTEDYNIAGSPSTVSNFNASCNATAPFTNDRCELATSLFSNGSFGSITLAAYPSFAGVLVLEDDNLGFLQGWIYGQSATAFNVPGSYGFNLTGFNDDPNVGADGEVDDIAQINASGTSLTGVLDENDVADRLVTSNLTGTFTPDSPATGRGSITVNTPNTYLGGLSLEYYVAQTGAAVLIEADADQVTTGIMIQQSAPGSSVTKSGQSARSAMAAAAAVTSPIRLFGKSRMAIKQIGK